MGMRLIILLAGLAPSAILSPHSATPRHFRLNWLIRQPGTHDVISQHIPPLGLAFPEFAAEPEPARIYMS